MNLLLTHKIDPTIIISKKDIILGTISFCGLEYKMLQKECSVIWYSWPQEVPKPQFNSSATYHPIVVFGKQQIQPRKTLCYGVSYKYSGVPHALEPETPDDIKTIMDLTNLMYPESEKHHLMCLANSYPSGYHCIGKHSDDESQMSELRDVICWVTGVTRRMIFRDKKKKDAVVLDISLPEGIYIMHGKKFQSCYKHEIPREKGSLFKKLSTLAPAELSSLKKADWLIDNSEQVKDKMPEKYEEYLSWAQKRDSYTMRFFKK